MDRFHNRMTRCLHASVGGYFRETGELEETGQAQFDDDDAKNGVSFVAWERDR